MPVWPITPIERRPSVTLTEWAVFEVPRLGPDKPWTRHLAGWSCEDRQGQVSSAVQAFDPATGKCITRSGRVYQLRGRPGLCGDGLYVWGIWMARDGLEESREVTAEVLLAIQNARAAASAPNEEVIRCPARDASKHADQGEPDDAARRQGP